MNNYPLVQDTISKLEIISLNKWLLKDEKLTKEKLNLKFEKNFKM